MSSKIVNVSVSLLLEAPTLARLDTATEGARAAFSEMGNSELETEELSQIPALLSVLPGAGRYQLRKKGCTSRNAGDLLPVFAPWRGCARAASILTTPDGDAFKFDPFDWTLANAFHGLIAADTGSGKSVTLGFLTLDALASGVQAILVDNGGSWRALTELMGGTYLPINARTSICPFPSYESALDPKTRELDTDELADVVTFLDLCVSGGEGSSFDTVAQHVVSQAVKRVYDQTLRHRPQERPVISLFRDALRTGFSDTQDATLGNDIARRLAIFCEGIYGDLLNRPSVLRFDDKLLTFEMAEVGNHPLAKKLAMATLMRAIADRASQKKRRTLVEVDEAHEYIGTDSVAAQFLASCYRKMRKFDVAMWLISQNLSDFIDSPVGKPIVQNALLKLFLRHQKGKSRDVVIDHFQLSPRARQAFENLEKRDGRYSDILMSYAGRMTTIRLALHPLAYWVLTTDPKDKDLVARARQSNPRLSQLELLEHLAARYPHGAAQGRVARAA